jgi:acylphosphatase
MEFQIELSMTSVRVKINGHVQGVGFRYAMRVEARRRGVAGWVRNRRDGSVEALLQGEADAVRALIDWARQGPPGACVCEVRSDPASDALAQGFEMRETV